MVWSYVANIIPEMVINKNILRLLHFVIPWGRKMSLQTLLANPHARGARKAPFWAKQEKKRHNFDGRMLPRHGCSDFVFDLNDFEQSKNLINEISKLLNPEPIPRDHTHESQQASIESERSVLDSTSVFDGRHID